jgi:transporter family-2 protein
MVYLLALLNGVFGTVSRLLNAALGTYVGSLESSWINHVVGSAAAGSMLLGWRTGMFQGGLPWYYWVGGWMGVLVVAAGNHAIPRLGAVLFALLALATQLVGSALLDHAGALGGHAIPLTAQRAAGLGLLFVGALLTLSERTADSASGDADDASNRSGTPSV